MKNSKLQLLRSTQPRQLSRLQEILLLHQGEIAHPNPELAIRYIVPTFMDRRVKKSDEILAQLRGYYPDLVCDPIRYNVRLSEAPGYCQTIFEYAPHSSGAQDYQLLTERILRDGTS